jgi:hypothetical protein
MVWIMTDYRTPKWDDKLGRFQSRTEPVTDADTPLYHVWEHHSIDNRVRFLRDTCRSLIDTPDRAEAERVFRARHAEFLPDAEILLNAEGLLYATQTTINEPTVEDRTLQIRSRS